jgi:hypothetical protein
MYSSEEEIIDIDRLQEDYESESTSSFEDSNEKCAIFGLEEGDTFENWDLAERQVENYSKEVGFGIIRHRINKNGHGEIKRHTFECQNSGKYCAKKRADVEETRERESVKISCPWKVNLNYNKGVIRVRGWIRSSVSIRFFIRSRDVDHGNADHFLFWVECYTNFQNR